MSGSPIELMTNRLLLTWDEVESVAGDGDESTLLSSLNAFHEFLTEYDRILARAVGFDCELNLYLDSLEERGFRFSLNYDLIPSQQLFLGERETQEQVEQWLRDMHLGLLGDMNGVFEEEGVTQLLERANSRARVLELSREPYFSLTPSEWTLAKLKRRYRRLLEELGEYNGAVTLKIT